MAAPAGGEHRRAIVIGLAGLGLVLVLFVVSRVLGGDGGAEDAAAPPAVPTSVPPGPPGTVPRQLEDADVAIPELPDTFEIVELRDPFDSPLLDDAIARQPPPPPPPGDGQQPPPGGGAPPPGDDDDVPPTDGEQRVTPDAPGDEVELIDVQERDGEPVVVVEVDGERFMVGEGERFGPEDEFQVVSIDEDDECVLFRRGDEPFTLCVGEERLIK